MSHHSNLVSILCTIWYIICILILFPIADLIIRIWITISKFLGIDKERRIAGTIFHKVNGLSVLLNPFWKLKITYVDKSAIPKSSAKVITVCNHISNLDAFCIAWALPYETKWVAKLSLFNIPFFGYMLRASHDIPLQFLPGNKQHNTGIVKESGERCIALCKKNLMEYNMGVGFFPEARRSPDKEILPFKKGAFHLAIETESDLIPVVISGSGDIWPVGQNLLRPGKIHVVVGTPIKTKGMTKENVNELTEKTRQIIIEMKKVADGEMDVSKLKID
jgi:1-acyl-sn-glycerol-3-phosphate acyltransferase